MHHATPSTLLTPVQIRALSLVGKIVALCTGLVQTKKYQCLSHVAVLVFNTSFFRVPTFPLPATAAVDSCRTDIAYTRCILNTDI